MAYVLASSDPNELGTAVRRGPTQTTAGPRLDRVAFKTSRLMDFVGRRELAAQIGHGEADWPLVALKELVDNSLDGCEEAGIAPAITISVTTDPGTISLADNGPGIRPETVADILDYSVRVSSREAYVSPTRGAQGNALKTVLAMGFALDGAAGETAIEAHGVAHVIKFGVDRIRNEPRISHEQQPSLVQNGTCVTIRWPNSACSILDAARDRFVQIVDTYLWLNPHLSLSVAWDDDSSAIAGEHPAWRKWLPSEPTSAHWYDTDRLVRYMAAHVAHDQDNGRDRTVREFISEFRGLSRSGKQKLVLEESATARLSLAGLVGNGEAGPAIARLLAAMQKHSRKINPKDLGIIGRDHLLARALQAGVNDKTFRYKSAIGETPDGLPIVIETAFGWCPEGHQRRIIAGVNWSPALGNPFRSFGHDGEGLEKLLADQRASAYEPIVMLVHLASPRVQFSDRGKTALILPGARQ